MERPVNFCPTQAQAVDFWGSWILVTFLQMTANYPFRKKFRSICCFVPESTADEFRLKIDRVRLKIR